jgi:hypothetical protein
LVTLSKLTADWLSMKFLPEQRSFLPLALPLSFFPGIQFWQWAVGLESKNTNALPPEVPALAEEPFPGLLRCACFLLTQDREALTC